MGEYFKSKNKKSRIEQLEEAAGISEPSKPAPKQEPTAQKPSGFVAPPYTGPRPWKGEKPAIPAPKGIQPLSTIMDDATLIKRATKGSKPFSNKELKAGYRKVG